MVYVSADGTLGGKKTTWTWIRDFMNNICSLVTLFFATMTDPSAIENSSASNRTYAQRNNGRSYRSSGVTSGGNSLGGAKKSNIRGVKDLGTANCAVGGG